MLIGWNLPSYLSAPLAGIPILVQQPGPFTAPFFDRKMGVFQPSLFGAARHLPLNWLVNWWLPRAKIWLAPFNRMADSLVSWPKSTSVLHQSPMSPLWQNGDQPILICEVNDEPIRQSVHSLCQVVKQRLRHGQNTALTVQGQTIGG